MAKNLSRTHGIWVIAYPFFAFEIFFGTHRGNARTRPHTPNTRSLIYSQSTTWRAKRDYSKHNDEHDPLMSLTNVTQWNVTYGKCSGYFTLAWNIPIFKLTFAFYFPRRLLWNSSFFSPRNSKKSLTHFHAKFFYKFLFEGIINIYFSYYSFLLSRNFEYFPHQFLMNRYIAVS